MSDQFWEARFSVVISGNELPFEQLNGDLGLKATRVIRTGDMLNKLPEVYAGRDEWLYTVQLTDPNGEDKDMNQVLMQLIEHREALSVIQQMYTVTLRLYIRSNKAMIAYRLMPETLQHLLAIGIPLDVTSLSWGDVGM